MENDEDEHSQVKQAVDEEYSEDAAEQPSIKISVPQGLESEIEVREEEDLETVLANLEFLARRQGFDTEPLSRSVDKLEEQEALPEAETDLLSWLQQLDEGLGEVEDALLDLDKRVDRVEDEFGGGEDSQLAVIMDRIQELDESVEEIPDDVSRHLGELREEISSLSDRVEDLDEYTASLDEDVEALRKRISEEEIESSYEHENTDEQDEDNTEEEGSEQDFITSEDVEEAREIRKERKQEEPDDKGSEPDASDDEDEEALYDSLSEFRELSTDDRSKQIRKIIQRSQPIGASGICKKLFGEEIQSSDSRYQEVQNRLQKFRDELETEQEGQSSIYLFPEKGGETVEEQETSTELEEEEEDEEEDGLFELEDFRDLPASARKSQVMKALEEIQPASLMEIAQELFGSHITSSNDEYTETSNVLQKASERWRKNTTGDYVIDESFEVTKTVTETSESEESQPTVEPEPEEPVPESVDTESSGGDDDKDFSDYDGRYSLEELREDDDLSVEAEVLKVFQECRKDFGAVSIPEATQVLFGSEASEGDEEYQVVWNHLETYSRKDGDRVERIEKEEEEDRFEIYGPFEFCNLYYDRKHKIICTECPPGESAVYETQEAINHKIDTRKDDSKEQHNSFISGMVPSTWYRNGKTIEKIVNRECGDNQ